MKWKYAPLVELDADGDETWTVGEVYYDDDGKFMGYTSFENPCGSTHEELIKDLEEMLKAVKQGEPYKKFS